MYVFVPFVVIGMLIVMWCYEVLSCVVVIEMVLLCGWGHDGD